MHIHSDMFAYSNPATTQGFSSTQRNMFAPLTGSDDGGAAPSDSGATNSNPIMQALAQALESLGLSLSQQPAPTSASAPASTAGSSTSATSGGQSSSPTSGSGSTASTSSSGSTTTTPPPAQNSSGDGDDDNNSGSHAAHRIASDIRHLVHALFQDVQAEETLAPASSSPDTSAAATTASASAANTTGSTSSSTTTTTTVSSPFAAGLAALISQVTSGSVPANLQKAFDKLVTDLERIGGVTPTANTGTDSTAVTASNTGSTSGATSGSSATSSATSTSDSTSMQALLLKFLTNLQQSLGAGYGAAATATGSNTTGVLLNQVA